jgi:opacity protein-like surface antigen
LTLIKYVAAPVAAVTLVASVSAQAQEEPRWSGLYVGAGISGTHMETDQNSPAQLTYDAYSVAPYGGKHAYGFAQAGADLQVGGVVIGAQIRHERTGSHGDSYWKVDELVSSNAKNITSLTARAGYLAKPTLLVYGNAGASFGRFDYGSVDERWGLVDDSLHANRNGATFGAGAEYRLTKRVSLFTEYNRTQFSKASSTFDYGIAYPSNWTYEFRHKLDSLKVGANVRF